MGPTASPPSSDRTPSLPPDSCSSLPLLECWSAPSCVMSKEPATSSWVTSVTATLTSAGTTLGSSLCLGGILLERSHKGHFVLLGLETTMTHLGGSIDEFEFDFLKSLPLGVFEERLSQSEDTLLGSNTTSLDHDKVLLDQTVMGE